MIKVIQQWLMDCLGLVINLDEDDFARRARDGVLIGKVLQSYDLISTEQLKLLPKCDQIKDSLGNYRNHILVWLDFLNIQINEYDLDDIVESRGDAALNLFYEMYGILHDERRFVTQPHKKEKIQPASGVSENKPTVNSEQIKLPSNSNDLCKPLVQNLDLLRWHKDKLKSLAELCDDSKRTYLEYLRAKQPKKTDYVCSCKLVCSCANKKNEPERIDCPEEKSEIFTLHELILQKNKALDLEEYVPNMCEAQNFVNRLHIKQKYAAETEIFRRKLLKELMANFWYKTIEEVDGELKNLVSEKIISQSFYEKQMIRKMLQLKHQKEVMKKDREFIDEELMRQKEKEITDQMFAEGLDSQQCMCNYYYERERIRELHRRLYAEKCRIQKERVQKMCQGTADDLVNLSMKIAEYKQQYNEEPGRRKNEHWAGLFTSGKPILSTIEPVDATQNMSDASENQESDVASEIERPPEAVYNDFDKYCHYEWPWQLENTSPLETTIETMRNGLNILGYIVHKMLLSKYPRHPNPLYPNFNFEFSVCVNGVVDATNMKKLKKLLASKGIQVLEVDDAVNYCLDAYKQEANPDLLEDIQSSMEHKPGKGKKGKGKKGKKGKGSSGSSKKKDKSSDSSKKKGKKGKGSAGSSKKKDKSSGSSKKKDKKGKGSAGSSKKKDKSSDSSKKKDKKKKKGKKGKGSANKSSKSGSGRGKKFDTKKNQTPLFFHDDDVSLSQKAHLGEVAQCCLDSGQPFTDYLISAMVVQYLNSIRDKKGWVLINYPRNHLQAIILEENISAKHLSKDLGPTSIVDISQEREDEIFKKTEIHRHSRIFPNPTAPKDPDCFETALTAYIKVIKGASAQDDRTDDNPLPILNYLNEDANPLDKFYADQGCNYCLYYEKFNYGTVKHLARLIIGDFSLPRKRSLELFGSAVLTADKDDKASKDSKKKGKSKKGGKGKSKKKEKGKKVHDKKSKDKKSKDKKSKGKKSKGKKSKDKKSKGKKGKRKDKKKGKQPKPPIILDDKEIQVPEPEEVIEEEELPPAKPGEEGWTYIEFCIRDRLQQVMGVFCENLEEIYTVYFRQVLSIRRLILTDVDLYSTYARNHLMAFINRSDNRQRILQDFQKTFNCLADHMRDCEEIKEELYSLVDHLKQALKEKSDENMRTSVQKREQLIRQNWMCKQIHELSNVYITAIQLESDRFVDSVQLLGDYYVAGITDIPRGSSHFQKELFRDLGRDDISLIETMPEVQNPFNVSFFHNKIAEAEMKAVKFVEKIKGTSIRLLESTQVKYGPTDKRRKCNENHDIELSQYIMDSYDDIFEEWKAGLNGETARVLLRFQLLKCDSKARIDEIVSKIHDTLTCVYHEIQRRYYNEINSIDHICDVLRTAVDVESAVLNELVISRDDFYVLPEIVFYPEPPPPEEPPIKQWENEGVFQIEELEEVYNVLADVAPSGHITKQCFVCILQDMLATDVDVERDLLVPELWRQLTTLEFDKVICELFSNSESIHWHDFIIHNLMLRMPTDLELLKLRYHFRQLDPHLVENVPVKDFAATEFWFEEQFSPECESDINRLNLIKDLLLRMYMVDAKTVNYSAMLIDFCKAFDPAEGFAKALAMVLGRRVCWDPNMGRTFVRNTFKQRMEFELAKREREIEMKENKEMAERIISDMIDYTVHKCDSVNISDVAGEESEMEGPNPSLSVEEEMDGECICEDLTCYCPEFSNVPIGFEADINPPMDYFLHFDTVLFVDTCALGCGCISCKAETTNNNTFCKEAERLFEECRNPDFNNDVLSHEFLNHPKFKQVLKKASRFSDKDPISIIGKVLNVRFKQG